MRLKPLLVTCALALAPQIAHAQAAQHVDPQTGNYVPTPDPGSAYWPDANKPNPNRLGNRLSSRNAATAIPPPISTANANDGLTPAQRMARNGTYNGQAPQMLAPDGTEEAVDQNGFVAMRAMPMYTPPGSTSAGNDPFAKPDWWPQ